MKVIFFLSVLIVLAGPFSSRAAIILNNGSFESTGAQYDLALGGLFEATGWTNLSSLDIQASSMLAGLEGTSLLGATGARILRLASDEPDPLLTGFIGQNLGTMVAGETYTFTADALGAPGLGGSLWGATMQLTSDLGIIPAIVYDTDSVAGVGAGANMPNAFNLSYTATLADVGNPLFLWLRADPSGPGQAIRGGIDNIQLTTTTAVPEPGTYACFGLLALCLVGYGKVRKRYQQTL